MKSKATAPGERTRFQSFETVRMHRRDLKCAPYNPRTIDKYAKEKLRAMLADVGLLAPLTYNKRTGQLVAGHQRLAILDALEGHDDWTMDLAVCDLPPPVEKEQNVAMNNTSAMGTWDVAALAELLASEDVDPLRTGFDAFDMQCMFPEDPRFESLFAADRAPDGVVNAVADVAAANEAQRQVEGPTGPRERDPNDRRFKQERQDERDREDSGVEFYGVVVFRTNAQREAFMVHVGAEKDDRYVDGARVAHSLGLVLP